MRGLYIHIPFCNSICSYCDFPKMMAKEDTKEEYINHLIYEIDSYKSQLKNIRSVYIGGGTPNSLNNFLLKRLFEALEPYLKDAVENTIEVNPELITEEFIHLIKEYHFNRVSIGVQTFQEDVLKKIRRNHTYFDVLKSVSLLRENGIRNINLDMIYGLPGQTMIGIKDDLKKLKHFKIKHISYYSLILEEKTILAYELKHHQISIPEDDLVADMAKYITQKLKLRGFRQYEVSNFCKKGYASLHNLGYWNCEEYIGIGASACGYLEDIRYKNYSLLTKYYQSYIEEKEFISKEEAKKEFMLLGLRKLEGIKKEEYFKKFGTYPEQDFDLKKLYQFKLIENKKGYIRIKKNKIMIANSVFEEFVG